MNHALLHGLAGLAGLTLAGRIGLSLLPPGWPGGHGTRELAVTWAASHVVGIALLALQAACLRALGLAPTPLASLSPWLALGIVRIALLPGAMRPRHELRPAPLGWLELCAAGIAAGALAFAALRGLSSGDEAPERTARALGALLGPQVGAPLAALLGPATLASAGVLVAGGLERARRAPLARALALFAVAGVALAHPVSTAPTLSTALYATGAAASVAWLRRGDRRGAVLGAGSLAATALAGPAGWPLAAAGLAVLVAATPDPGRGRVLALAVVPALAFLAAGLALGPPEAQSAGEAVNWGPTALLAVLAALPPLLVRARRVLSSAAPSSGAPEPGRELLASALWLSGALIASIPRLARSPDVTSFCFDLAPTAILFAGLLLAPAENTQRSE